MPQFEMPPQAEGTARPDAAGASLADEAPRADTADPLRPDSPAPDPPRPEQPSGPRRRFGWRQLLIAGLAGVMAGGAIPAALQSLDDSAASAQVEGLRTVALEYLTAIATGRAGVATQLAPVHGDGRVAPDAVLQSADPITDYAVQLVQVDGGSGSADVRYRVGGIEVFRALEARLVDGEWSLRTSLAEVADVTFGDPIARVQVAGVPLAGTPPVLLYPGSYRVDAFSGPFFLSGGDEFVVDGDARTPTAPYVTAGVVPRIRDLATELALDTVADCQMRARCPVGHGLRLLPVGEPYPVDADAEGGAIDLAVPIMALDGQDTQWFDVRLRAVLDADGAPAEWLCGEPGAGADELHACRL
ncbi:hypothetical protein ABA31_07430 [Agrococcus baldri]|uniref:Uncharacterized protein n=2 Tax=Agrococcus baldri TaxID=153730 RepID=A0AA87RJM9_9MICO|nr:hypothetical protein ABA31_07430 [Agrococcus baldri]